MKFERKLSENEILEFFYVIKNKFEQTIVKRASNDFPIQYT